MSRSGIRIVVFWNVLVRTRSLSRVGSIVKAMLLLVLAVPLDSGAQTYPANVVLADMLGPSRRRRSRLCGLSRISFGVFRRRSRSKR